MITINSAQSNTVILYLDSTKQYFLFEFVSGLACGNIYIIPENVSTCADYQKFVINHDFGFGGVWTLNVYEQTSPVNTNPANATFLMTDLVKIVVDETCFNTPPIITNPCPEINPIDFSCEDLLTPYTGLTTEQINCVLASLTCDYLKDNLTYEQIACFGPPLSDYSCAQLLEGLIESQLSCLLQSFDCDFLNDPYLGLTSEQLACLPDKPISVHTCEELLDPYLGLTDDQKTCVLQSLSCEFLNNQYTGLTDEQRECVGKPIQEYTCEQLIDPYTGLSNNQKSCVLQALPCELITDEYTGLTDNQKACIIPTLSCDILEENLTQEQIDCLIQLQYDVDYRAILNYATVRGDAQPSNVNKLVQNDLMVNLKAAATNGLSDYSLIRVWGNDINHGVIPADMGFDGYNWANIGSNQSARVNTITKTLKFGYYSNGVDSRVVENWNPLTSGLSKTDFLWFNLFYTNGSIINSGGFLESLFDPAFLNNMQVGFFKNNTGDNSFGQLFSYTVPFSVRPAQALSPTYQRLILWRSGDDMYIMINGTQYGPFTSGAAGDLTDGVFNSFCRYITPATYFEFLDSTYVKNIFGFAKESTINKSLLDTALATYANAVY